MRESSEEGSIFGNISQQMSKTLRIKRMLVDKGGSGAGIGRRRSRPLTGLERVRYYE